LKNNDTETLILEAKRMVYLTAEVVLPETPKAKYTLPYL